MQKILMGMLSLLLFLSHPWNAPAQVTNEPTTKHKAPVAKEPAGGKKDDAWKTVPAAGTSYSSSGSGSAAKESGYGTQDSKVYVPYAIPVPIQ